MLIKRRLGWELPESQATPESVFFNRRAFLGAGAGLIAGAALPQIAAAQGTDPTLDLYPAKQNPAYTLDRPVTEADLAANYNNFYEFGTSKDVVGAAKRLQPRPWTIAIDGMVEKPFEIGFDDLIRKIPLEERLYRFRCVEAWSMAVPWTGFPLKALVELAKPQSGAKYVRFETFMNPRIAPGQSQRWYPWPYTEGLTMAEATNELALMVTGIYGKPVPNQHGAPLRLITPWKYGFKSVKSINKISFVAERPKTFWEGLQASEYGFWANVNPEVPHPRWSQASEQLLGSRDRRPTLLFNGYAEQVAGLYKGLEGENLYM
ncbi:protein-methionine-sulfoxide reductase catalytic subunit MsrP [Bosea caraganae]|uniref:Protein-methionine-sulfoxide reductase catalytic subunit MsrP n=1 Tax=Bosea caraganae TaxID=2763117 RepID=A0A370L1B8_9HYPH|nr:protein-methionine-sulfoxide reductase catalytic subunit MsrP [Bosea caraganae]RDJ21024.1 protein-methionine-sulfoxide reductase catalytic subunit MsrP [Bosea caraganae]RDJ28523.1 protein-methionine-sulfoxide reductase catalytic subunit MsrP [Bosea caraganae]